MVDISALDQVDFVTNVSLTSQRNMIYDQVFNLTQSNVSSVQFIHSQLLALQKTDYAVLMDSTNISAASVLLTMVASNVSGIVTSVRRDMLCLRIFIGSTASSPRLRVKLTPISINYRNETILLDPNPVDPSANVTVEANEYAQQTSMMQSYVLDLRNRTDIVQITVRFNRVDLEVLADTLSVFTSITGSAALVVTGSTVPAAVTYTSTKYIRLLWAVDRSISGQGFSLVIEVKVSPPSTRTSIITFDPNSLQNGVSISSAAYLPMQFRSWVVDVRNRTDVNIIVVTWTAFGVESTFDSVRLLTSPSTVLSTYTGTSLPPRNDVSTKYAEIQFMTDNSISSTGFNVNLDTKLLFSTLAGNWTLLNITNSLQQTIVIDSSAYRSMMNQSWELDLRQRSDVSVIILTFAVFSLEVGQI